MFEDSLVESTGRIRTRSQRYAIGSFALQAIVLAALALVPYLYPAALPKEALSALLVAPQPPSAPAQLPRAPSVRTVSPAQLAGLTAPATIPRRIAEGDDARPTPPGIDYGPGDQGKGDVRGAMFLLGNPPTPPQVAPAKPAGPIRISQGVAQGHVLVPIEPVYPAIAKAAHIQGTVTIEAVISKDGLVEQARVVSGPAMLVQAALAALSRARYAPFRLDGKPVDVETTINIEFVLGD